MQKHQLQGKLLLLSPYQTEPIKSGLNAEQMEQVKLTMW
ncbi:Uncharacterised protein [Acinetobacter baumannii]|nr:Uncharacterised protein [Acinetobacter baumannii]